MKRLLIFPLILAACARAPVAPVTDPASYVPTDAPVPFAVQALLPQGVTPEDVRVANNCYGYVFNGLVYPVLIPRGTQYCL
ncbi:MAG: hypothetical protein AAGF30_16570 [Pseudomonadota bacterium]